MVLTRLSKGEMIGDDSGEVSRALILNKKLAISYGFEKTWHKDNKYHLEE